MPIPEPKAGETEQEFISRCMSVLSKEDPDKLHKQRLAICYSKWREAKMTEPTVQDVHIDKPLENVSIKVKKIKRNKIENVPIFQAGTWKGQTYTIEDLDEIVRNTNALIKSGLHEPPVKIGHSENQRKLLEEIGLPAFGYVEKIYRIGDQIFADLIDVPDKVVEWITLRHYDKVSSEIYLDYEHPRTGEKIGKVLRAVAFLGADIPAVKGLGSIVYHNEEKNKKNVKIFVFEDKNLEEVNSMKKWTIDEIKRVLPCCVDFVQKYMESKNKKFLDGEELAMVLAEKRFQEVKEEDKVEEESIECPEGYKWDEKLGRCIRLDEKQEDRVVCPKGYEWNEEQGRCVKVEVKEVKETVESQEGENKKVEIDRDVLIALLKKAGIEVGDDEEISEGIIKEKLEKLGNEGNEEDEEVELEITEDEENKFLDILEKIVESQKVAEFQLPGGTPRGWTRESFRKAFESMGGTFTDCVDRMKDVVDSPERFCAWLKYRATDKWPGTKEWRASEKEENKEIAELKEKIRKYEEKIFKDKVKEFIEKNREVLLPRFDEYIQIFCENLSDKIVKFDDKEVDLRKLFLDFLQDIVKSKVVKFGEIAKVKESEIYEISDEEREKVVRKYSEVKPNVRVENIDLALLAEKISGKENIPYRDALIKAYKILNKKEE